MLLKVLLVSLSIIFASATTFAKTPSEGKSGKPLTKKQVKYMKKIRKSNRKYTKEIRKERRELLHSELNKRAY